MKLVVGLGNPGPEYAGTRHNAGFAVVDRFATERGIALREERFGGRFGSGRVAGAAVEVALLQPQTFMNRSGAAVAAALAALPGLEPERDLLVVFDDVDLPFGRLRMRRHGGAGGQRGVADVIDRIGHDRFPRLRFGIGRPAPGTDTTRHVLSPFPADEALALPRHLARAADAVTAAVCLGVERAMNEVNRDPQDEGAVGSD